MGFFIDQLQNPRAVLLLVLCVELGVIGFVVGQHFENNFEQTLSQASQGASVAHALFAFLFIIGLSPNAGSAEAVGPEVNGMS